MRCSKILMSWMFCCVWLCGFAAMADFPADEDSTRSPYFWVNSDNPEIDQLPLLLTTAEVDITGVIADVTVTQIYKNEGTRAIEAIYVFPASTRAAVYGMTMTIGERTIFAQIKEKQQARQEYEAAKEAGQSASLLEQHRPNVFQMNVANILPGDRVTVKLQYTELLVPTDGVYEFVYPTVVGPRYSPTSAANASSSEEWVANPYVSEGEAPAYLFDMTVNLSTGIPIQDVTCTSHPVDVQYAGPNAATIGLDDMEIIRTIKTMPPDYLAGLATTLKEFYIGDDFASLPAFYGKLYHLISDAPQSTEVVVEERTAGEFTGDRDYILKYRLAGERIESGLLLYAGDASSERAGENFFVMMMQPPAQVQAHEIPPREYIFLVDVSGSMHGFPLDTSKQLLRDLVSSLKPTDTLNVILFAGTSALLSEQSLPATPQTTAKAIKFIENAKGSGGTELLPALQRTLDLPRTAGISRTIVVVTDGYVSVEQEAFNLIGNNLNQANVFAFGIGSSVNRHLIEGMARVGLGEPFVVTKPEEAAAQATKFRTYIQSPVLTGITCEFDGFEAYDVEPVSIPDVLAARPVIVFGKWRGEPAGGPAGEIVLNGYTGQGSYRQTFEVERTNPSDKHRALRYLWARKRIERLGDYNMLASTDARVHEITELGLHYNLLTEYTSFVAVDPEVRRTEQETTTVKQPQPRPQGVSGNIAAVPEPGTMLLVGTGLVLIAWRVVRKKRRIDH